MGVLLNKTQRSYIALLHFLNKVDNTYFLVFFKEKKYSAQIINIFLIKFKIVIIDYLIQQEGIKECDIPELILLYEQSVDNYTSALISLEECLRYLSLIFNIMFHFDCLINGISLHEKLRSENYISYDFEDSYIVDVPNKPGILFNDIAKLEQFINSLLIEYFTLYDCRNVVFLNYNKIHLIYERID